jgi:hypothetical protein
MNREAEKSVIYGTWAARFVEGKKAKIGLRLNCTTQRIELAGLGRWRIQSWCRSLFSRHHLITLSTLASTFGES